MQIQQDKDVIWQSLAKALVYELGEEDNGSIVCWTEVCSIRYLCVNALAVRQVTAVARHVPSLAGAGVKHRRVCFNGRRFGIPRRASHCTH